MRLLLIDVLEPLSGQVRQLLGTTHRVEIFAGDTRDKAALAAHAGCDVVIQGYPRSGVDADVIDTATRGTWNVLTALQPRGYVQLSTMRLFDAYPRKWAVIEGWLPKPSAHASTLAIYLAELVVQEITRVRATAAVTLRLDTVLDVADPSFLSNGDAIDTATAAGAVATAVRHVARPGPGPRWRAMHVVSGSGRYPRGAAEEAPLQVDASGRANGVEQAAAGLPETAISAVPGPVSVPSARHLTIYGAGGPLAAAMVGQLPPSVRYLLTDLRAMREFAAAEPQSPGAPRPQPPAHPHREALVDITDPGSVLAGATDSDGLVNLAVARSTVEAAFRVNVVGAYNVMTAAVQLGIRRVVQTGPALTVAPHPIGYLEARDVDERAPARAGDHLYFLTKHLATEVCRVFAEAHGIACPTLLFCRFVDPSRPGQDQPHPFVVSWADAGRALAAAVQVRDLPEPFSVIHVQVPSPHGRYRVPAHNVLGWVPTDDLSHLWRR